MADTSRPIRIEIPEELKLTADEIALIQSVFESEVLAKLTPRGPNEPLVGNPTNTTRLAVQIDVIRPRSRGRSTRKAAKKMRKPRPPK